MASTLYVANFAPVVTEEKLRELFGEYGEVTSVEFGTDEKFGERYALVTMASERSATQANHGLNGHRIDDRYLAISYPKVDVRKPLASKQRKAVEAIAAELGETEKVPVRRIEAMVRLCGTSFVQTIVQDALEVEAGGGLMTSDGARRRTLGGVFFYLAKARVAPPVRRIVYNRKGKIPPPEEE